MEDHPFDALSAHHREKVRSALVAAFGSTPIDAIARIAGGASTASTFRLEVGRRAYLLRVTAESAAQSASICLDAYRRGGGDCPGGSLYR
jgi:hypothetical protein